jgi:hypothetical protein
MRFYASLPLQEIPNILQHARVHLNVFYCSTDCRLYQLSQFLVAMKLRNGFKFCSGAIHLLLYLQTVARRIKII